MISVFFFLSSTYVKFYLQYDIQITSVCTKSLVSISIFLFCFFLAIVKVRASKEAEEFLLNPFGLLFSEVTASSLIKCDLKGNVIDEGCTNLGIYIIFEFFSCNIRNVYPFFVLNFSYFTCVL